ncbi:PHP domain-containing protein [Clostridium sp.]|uniref:PHP domain-containing protein n=1 Tax=Clostridium sp. TaxID=1506 RepID=UPI003F3262AD
MSYIDLHVHSHYSDDGEFSPKDLIDLALENGIKYLSIADHNSVDGINEALEYSNGKDIKIIPAIELDCTIDNVNLHLLGYDINYKNNIFKKIEDDIISQEQIASKKRIKLIRELGINFDDEVINSLSKNGVVNGEMIAEAAIIFDSKCENPLLKPYYKGGLRSDNPYVNFYWDFCSQGNPAYVEVKYISLEEAIRVILDNGGTPILAHPGNNIKENKELLDKIISCGVKGIEVYTTYHNKDKTQFYKEYALSNNLLITCGSDFHGKTKPNINIGGVHFDDSLKSLIYEFNK